MLHILFVLVFYTIEQTLSRCTRNYNEIELAGVCYECPDGFFGINCSETCPPNFYGVECLNKCNCQETMFCHIVFGCISLYKNDSEYPVIITGQKDNTIFVDKGMKCRPSKILSLGVNGWFAISLVLTGNVFFVVFCIFLRKQTDVEADENGTKLSRWFSSIHDTLEKLISRNRGMSTNGALLPDPIDVESSNPRASSAVHSHVYSIIDPTRVTQSETMPALSQESLPNVSQRDSQRYLSMALCRRYST